MAWVGFLTLAAATASVQGKLTVHVVPHTHDDVGWLKTVDQYYAGKNNSIQHAYVKMILDTVIDSLRANPDRRFTYVEQAFFYRWWRQQTPEIQEVTKQLVKSGQLSFTNGGWCMHDEAAPHYIDMIDQTTLGHKFLMDNFGLAPKTGWQLDPFGHSATQAALLSAEVGFAGLFFGRIDYQDLKIRIDNSAAEFVWRASPSLGDDAQVFSGLTGSYGGNYGPPSGFNWNEDSSDEPVQDDPLLEDYNVKSRVDDFVNFALWQGNHTRGQNIMFTMGSDFQYENAHEWFTNLDKIIQYVNLDGRVQAKYSTPEMYLAAKVEELQSVQWPLKTDDFFPYADGPHQFWTGYFTSRPALKRFIRDSSAFLQVVRQIDTLGAAHDDVNPGIQALAEAMGVVQHHDAVSGTAKQHVTFDYAGRVARGRDAALAGLQATLTGLLDVSAATFCELRNVSVCPATQNLAVGSSVDFVLWNGLAQARSQLVELPVAAGKYQLTEIGGSAADLQLVPALPSITNYGEPAGGSDTTLLFTASVPPLGAKAYRLTRSPDEQPTVGQQAPVIRALHDPVNEDFTLENENLALQFCDGALCKVKDKKSGVTIAASQNWLWYNASEGDKESGQKSGAYIFRPTDPNAIPASVAKVSTTVVQGALANEVHQTIGDWITQRIRLPAGASHAEITYTVGPVPVVFHGMEVISRITTDIKNADVCYTDSNGREMLKRQRDFRPTWKLNQTESVAGNYFPVSTAVFIKDDNAQLTVLTDASQAGTGCVQEGQIELMVHRRLLQDDSRGVAEPLNETRDIRPYVGDNQGQHYGPGLVIRGRHWLTLTPPAQAASNWRPLMDELYMPLQPFFSSSAVSKSGFSALQQALPPNVQIVSLSRWDDKVLLRLAHQFGLGEDEALSAPVVVDLGALFAGQTVVSAEERGLAATISRDEVLARRIAWKIEGEGATAKKPAAKAPKGGMPMDDLKITLGPLQIRTFWVKLVPASAVRGVAKSGQASWTVYA